MSRFSVGRPSVVERIDIGEVWLDARRDEITEWTAAAPCEEGKRGVWVCLTHNQVFRHNMEKDGHIENGYHRLGWLCLEHGLEVP